MNTLEMFFGIVTLLNLVLGAVSEHFTRKNMGRAAALIVIEASQSMKHSEDRDILVALSDRIAKDPQDSLNDLAEAILRRRAKERRDA